MRFPLLSAMIFNNLDVQSFIRSKEASRGMAAFLGRVRLFWVRIVEIYSENFEGFSLKSPWNHPLTPGVDPPG